MKTAMPRPLNILMLGGAKRVSMARHFIAAAAAKGFDARIYSFELNADVPAAAVGDVIKGGRWSDADILEQLDKACRQNEIDIILPFVDGAVEIAARYSMQPGHAWSPVSAPDTCRAMFDKVEADRLLRCAGVPLPRVVEGAVPEFFPVIAKPRTGSASKGIVVVRDIDEWRSLGLDSERYIVQEFIGNRREYTLDCYIDRRGNVAAVSPRERIEVVGGEVSRSVTVDLPAGVEIARKAIEAAGLRGAVTVQLIEDKDTGRLMLMEINPRLGGGAVCSLYAGVNLPAMIIDDWQEKDVAPVEAVAGVNMTRYMQEVVFGPDNRVITIN